ncbi:MAG: SIS domain-containing protein [Rhodobacteraceae bacterium]|jgi:6-phospho-3-hexuloisomerase|nr:SIS domain-containing protein [Paracoccaceae bacterium]
MTDLAALAARAADEIRTATAGVDAAQFAALVEALATAGRIACHGVGREGLMMRALAMRLYHLGLDAHVVGDMSCPPVGPGDLLLVSAGPGAFSTVLGLLGVARDAGAMTACITAQPGGAAPAQADRVLVIPAQTMASDRGAQATSVLPMGSLYEGAQYLTFELLILALRDRLGVDPAAMRARHTNLE